MKGSSATETDRQTDEGRLREKDLLAALPARSAHREVKVGLFVLIGITAFLVALFSLTDVGTFRGRYYITTVIEHAGGMRNGDPVQMRGVNIGRVTGFDMVPEGVAVTMEIYNRYRVPADSRVTVASAGLLGGVVVAIEPGQSEERADREDILPGRVEQDIFGAADGLATQAEVVLGRTAELLSDQTVGSIGASAQELQALLVQLSALAATQRQELALLSASLRRSAEGVEVAATGPELQRAVANVDSLTERLDATTITLNSASESLNEVLGRIERGEGTLGLLSNDEELYTNLNATVVSLRELITDIQANPRRYINLELF